jgi:hypothetical protein
MFLEIFMFQELNQFIASDDIDLSQPRQNARVASFGHNMYLTSTTVKRNRGWHHQYRHEHWIFLMI